MTAILPVRPGAASALPPAGDPRFLVGHWAALAGRTMGRVAPWLVRGIMGLAFLAFLVLAAGPHVLRYRTMTMLTSGLSPEIDPGDVTVVTPIAISEVTEGMVITYHKPIEDHSVVTHRVVSVETGPTALSRSGRRVTPIRRSTPGPPRWRATPPTSSAQSSLGSVT